MPLNKEPRSPKGGSRLSVFGKSNYLVSFCITSPFMASSDFMLFLVCFFFILALESIGLLAFMVCWVVGLVVWAEATDTLPTGAGQHAAISRFRILVSCWNTRAK